MRKRREPGERENARSMRIDSLESLDWSRKLVIELFVLSSKKGGRLSRQREQEDVNNRRKNEGEMKLGDVKKRKKGDIKGETKLGDVEKKERDIEGEMKLGDVKKKKRDIEGETKLGDVRKRKRDIEGEKKLEDVKRRQTWSDSDSKTGWQSKSALIGCTEPTYLADLVISPQYTERALMIEGIASFAGLSGQRTPGRWKERGECHRLPTGDMMEASWGGATPSMVVSGDAGVGTVRNGSQGD